MRQFSPLFNLVFASLCAVALAGSLTLPWYATAPGVADALDEKNASDAYNSALEDFAAAVPRWFTNSGTSGADALGGPRTALLVLCALTIVLCVGAVLPGIRRFARDLLRLAPLVAPGIVMVLLVSPPGGQAAVEMRFGIFVALALAGLMASAAWHGSEVKDPRPAPAPYRPPAPPVL